MLNVLVHDKKIALRQTHYVSLLLGLFLQVMCIGICIKVSIVCFMLQQQVNNGSI